MCLTMWEETCLCHDKLLYSVYVLFYFIIYLINKYTLCTIVIIIIIMHLLCEKKEYKVVLTSVLMWKHVFSW